MKIKKQSSQMNEFVFFKIRFRFITNSISSESIGIGISIFYFKIRTLSTLALSTLKEVALCDFTLTSIRIPFNWHLADRSGRFLWSHQGYIALTRDELSCSCVLYA